MSRGVFEEYFSYDPETKKDKHKQVKKSEIRYQPRKKSSETPEDERERRTSQAFDLADAIHKNAMSRTDSTEKLGRLIKEVIEDATGLAFTVTSPMLFDVLNALDIPFKDLNVDRIHAAQLIIWSYIQEYDVERGKRHEK